MCNIVSTLYTYSAFVGICSFLYVYVVEISSSFQILYEIMVLLYVLNFSLYNKLNLKNIFLSETLFMNDER